MANVRTREIPIAGLEVSPFNVRRHGGDVSDLAVSIQSVGLLQPIVVRPIDDDRYEVVAGSRRLEACRRLGWQTITSVVRPLTDREALILSLSENIQQETLDPVERAQAIRRLVDDFAQEMPRTEALRLVAKQVGKRPSTLNEWLAVLRTTEGVRRMVRERRVSTRVAARLSTLPRERQEPIARAIAEENLTRHDALRVVQVAQKHPSRPVQEVVAEVRDEPLEEIAVSVSFPGRLYSALAQRAKAERCSIQEVIRRASRAYVGYDNPPGRKEGKIDRAES